MVLVCTCFMGCSLTREIKQDDPFRIIYSEKTSDLSVKKKNISETRLISLSASKMPLGNFCRLLSDYFKIGIVFSETLSDKHITAEFKDTDLNTVFTVISKQLSVDLVKVGNTFYLGSLNDDDKVILIRRVLSHDEENLQKIVNSFKSSSGRGEVLSGRIVVFSDKDFVIRKVSEALDDLDRFHLQSWIIQLYFIVLRKDALAEGGLTMSTSGTISYNISENKIDVKDFKLEGLFSGLLESSYADLYASPMLILRDGVKGNWFDGQRVPVAQKTVSDYGTVTTSGFDYVEAGLSVTATCRESKIGGFLVLDISLSDIQSYVEGNPLTSKTNVNVSLDMIPNKVYLLSELQRYSVLDRESKTLLLARNKGKSVIQVWGRIYRIDNYVGLEAPLIADDNISIKEPEELKK